ncbi:hypothetical protein ACFOZY_03190 [Chungangia koreensis]|uniref:Uncharacterized protein n=1 Tax=Chungangia koreensis TaxID=752657 RepID=A0ABV8X235_9LACT
MDIKKTILNIENAIVDINVDLDILKSANMMLEEFQMELGEVLSFSKNKNESMKVQSKLEVLLFALDRKLKDVSLAHSDLQTEFRKLSKHLDKSEKKPQPQENGQGK